MKVCIPTEGEGGAEGFVGAHFGRVPTFTFIDIETDKTEVVPNTSHHMGGAGDPPHIMAAHNADILVCSGLGRRAITLFEELGIEVYIGASGSVKDAIAMWQEGKLTKATQDSACSEHAFHGERESRGQCGGDHDHQ